MYRALPNRQVSSFSDTFQQPLCRLLTISFANSRRVRREPDCTAWCYIRLKDKGKQAKAALVADEIPSFYPRPPIDPENDDSRYRFSFLDDKFL